MEKYGVYVKTDNNDNIIAVNSDVFQHDLEGWVKIDEGNSMEHLHAQNNYFKKPIRTDLGVYRYKLLDGDIHELNDATIAQMEKDILNSQVSTPSQLDIIEAQVTYTAMMTDTLLEV